MWCRGGKTRSQTLLFHGSLLAFQAIWKGGSNTLAQDAGAVYKWTHGLLMSLPTRCMPVLMMDLNDRLARPRAEEAHDLIGTVGAGVEGDSATRFRALLRRHSIAVPQMFHLAAPTFYGSSGRSRIDFVATHTLLCNFRASLSISRLVDLRLTPAAGPRDHMPLTLDLATNGMRHCPDPTCGRWDHELTTHRKTWCR